MDPISRMMSSGGDGATYTMTSVENNVYEGDSLTFNVSTTNVFNNTTLYWGITSNASDFSTSQGTVTITGTYSSGSGSFTVTPDADYTTEGSEQFDVTLYFDSGRTQSVATVSGITINDPTFSMSSAANNVDEGSNLVFTVTTTYVNDNTTLYWKITNNAAEFTSDNGTVTLTSNSGTFTVTPSADSTTEGSEQFDVTLYADSGFVNSLTSVTGITINDTSTAPTTWNDISTATYVRQADPYGSSSVTWRGLFFKSDGTKMYTLGGSRGRSIREWSLSTAWDLSTLNTSTYVEENLTTETGGLGDYWSGLTFSGDGTKFYSHDYYFDRIYQFDLSTAWDLSTFSYNDRSWDFSTIESSPRGISINADGTKLYMSGQGADILQRFTMSTAYDITTLSTTTTEASSWFTKADGLFVKPDGTQVFVVDYSSDKCYQWDLSTAHDITGITSSNADSELSLSSRDGSVTMMYISPDGDHVYFAGNDGTNPILQYSL